MGKNTRMISGMYLTFLGFTKSQREIEANPDQISIIVNLRPPKSVREVQRLTEMPAALNHFISKSAERCRPFFDLIKKGKSFQWRDKSDQPFEQLKAYLTEPPLLSTPVSGEALFIYLTTSSHAVSATVVKEEHEIQKLVY